MKPLTQGEFIALFPHTRFRYIHDVKKVVVQGSDSLDQSWNEKGYGVFYTVNGFPSTGKADESRLLSLNANYVDFDVDANLSQEEKEKLIQETLMSGLESGAPTPTIVNRTQKGAHLIWLYPEPLEPTPENIAKWRQVQKRMVQCFKGDPAAKDPSRVLRVPYTFHLKDPANPFEIKIASYKPDAHFTLEELDVAAPKYAEAEVDEKAPAKELLEQGVSVGKGLRHMAMAQVAGLLLKDVTTPEQLQTARLALYGWDRVIVKSPEPFAQRKVELDKTVDGIWHRESNNRAAESAAGFKEKIHVWTINEILSHDFGEEEWVVESLITKQGITAFSGNPGDYKTWLTIHIALCVSRGDLVFGKFPTTQGSVLVIDEEDHIRLIKGRLVLLGAKETDPIHYLSQSGFKADDNEKLNAITNLVKQKEIKLVVLDSLVRIHDQEENDATGMSRVFSSVQKLIEAGASVLFTHHHRKQQGFNNQNSGQSMRGSSDILAAVDSHIAVDRKRDDKNNSLVITQTKSRQAEALVPFQLSIKKGPSGPSGFEYVGEYDEKKIKAASVATSVVFLLSDGLKSRQEIHEALDEEFGKSSIDEGIKLAEAAGDITRVSKDDLPKADRHKAHYRLKEVSSAVEEVEEQA